MHAGERSPSSKALIGFTVNYDLIKQPGVGTKLQVANHSGARTML